MIDLSVRGLVKGFEQGNDILKGITFDVNAGERVGILGRNGCGKTTFFRILSGELQPDAGTVSIASGRRLGLISQIPVYPDGWTTEDVLREAHRQLYDMEARMNELTARMATDDSPALLAEYDRLSENFRRLGGYDMEHERNRVANGLDIPAAMRAQPFDSLSGGEKTRVNLARLILEDTDILLLDEPTNHLDLRATEWLEAYLLHFRGTVLVISHDRYFLSTASCSARSTLRPGRRSFTAATTAFTSSSGSAALTSSSKNTRKDQAKLQQLTEAAAKLHLWAFMGNDKLHKRAFSIEKRMEKLETTERPTEARKLNVHFTAQEFRGDDVLTMSGLGKRYGERTLFHDLDLTVTGGERIALIGDNGAGKTTFLRLVMNEETPDTGWVQRGPSVRTAYLPQIVRFAVPERSMLDTMLYECKCTPQEARDQLGAYGFCGEDVLKPVSALSGGELSRLRLCMLMRREINFLILDEPTNHLDIASREWIEDALSDYTQALLFVSHDRYFIEKFATRIWLLENGTITDYRGTYEEFRAYRARQTALQQTAKAVERKKSRSQSRSAPRTPRERASARSARSKSWRGSSRRSTPRARPTPRTIRNSWRSMRESRRSMRSSRRSMRRGRRCANETQNISDCRHRARHRRLRAALCDAGARLSGLHALGHRRAGVSIPTAAPRGAHRAGRARVRRGDRVRGL